MEIDPRILRERVGQALFISNVSVAFPLALGFLAALVVYPLLAPDVDYLPFALFMGVSMSITAFPVLARILIERRMLKRPVGALAMAGAAIDDVTAWALLALATAVAGTGSGSHVFVVIGLAIAFTAGMFIIVRPLLKRVSTAYDEVGHVPPLWLGAIFVAVLLSAFLAQQIGIAAIFGAFVMGLIMPRHAGLTDDVSQPARGLRRHGAAAALLHHHGPADRGRVAEPAGALADHARADRCRDRRQVDRSDGRSALRRLRAPRVGGHRGSDEHARA